MKLKVIFIFIFMEEIQERKKEKKTTQTLA